MTELKLYAKALKSHPGVPVAAALMFLGFVAGAKGDNWFSRGLIGAAIMSIFWIPVLCTAWINRKNA